jgi:two-component system chemotaxis response regulator CheB
LVEISEGGMKRYRCHTGHAFTARALGDDGLHAVEMSVWSTIAHLEELKVLFAEMQKTSEGLADREATARYSAARKDVEELIGRMRTVAYHPVFDRARGPAAEAK